MKRVWEEIMTQLFKKKRATNAIWTAKATTADIVRAKKAMRRLINEVIDEREKRLAQDAWDRQPWI